MFKRLNLFGGKALSQEISVEQRAYLSKIRFKKTIVRLTQLAIFVSFFSLWELLARWKWIDAFLTSQPSKIYLTIIHLYQQGILFHHIGITCLETVLGFSLGTILGTLIAMILWWSDFLAKVCEPYLIVLNSLPKIALAPIFIVWIGAGPSAIIVMALAISLIITILEVLNGFLGVDQDKVKLVQTFGAGKWQIFTKVILPSSFHAIINALKVNVGLSWVGVITGEFLVSKGGIGYLIVYGGQVFQLDLVMASVIILAVAAALMYQAVVYLERFLVKW
ncbi:MAG TPA: sulfonate ABC transporter permease [Firmicutes bacterium]|jgi:NitT/TauT family transport system permease protein|nr:sulfonate ABC transporter permease [Bacillota bacterium]